MIFLWLLRFFFFFSFWISKLRCRISIFEIFFVFCFLWNCFVFFLWLTFLWFLCSFLIYFIIISHSFQIEVKSKRSFFISLLSNFYDFDRTYKVSMRISKKKKLSIFCFVFCSFSLMIWVKWRKKSSKTQQKIKPSWRNRLARSAVNRKVGGSSPPDGGFFFFRFFVFSFFC